MDAPDITGFLATYQTRKESSLDVAFSLGPRQVPSDEQKEKQEAYWLCRLSRYNQVHLL